MIGLPFFIVALLVFVGVTVIGFTEQDQQFRNKVQMYGNMVGWGLLTVGWILQLGVS